MNRHVVVIGGGVGGLAAAVRLAAQGVRVTLVEKNDRVGGKLNLWEAPHPHRRDDRPFRFDTGPSLLTLPFVFEQLFESAGRRLQDFLTLRRLDPIARYSWRDGTTFELRDDRDALEAELRRIAPDDVSGFFAFAEAGRRIWDLSAEMFLFNAPEQLLNGTADLPSRANEPLEEAASDPLYRAKVGWKLLSTPVRIGMFRRFSSLVNRNVRHRRLREILYQYATYSGASPFRAPATLACIPYAERNFGGWYPVGGMYRLAEALERLARDLGVCIRLGCPARRIEIGPLPAASSRRQKNAGVVRGVELADGGRLACDAVLCNADVVWSYRHLIDARYRRGYSDRVLNKLEAGGSGLVLLLGVEGEYTQLAHHNKFMPRDYRNDLRAMFDSKTVPSDPCIYVCASTRTDPSQAPPGCENLFVLASAPPLDGRIDWRERARRYRDHLVRSLEEDWGLGDLRKRIVVERWISPLDLESLYNANAGSIYGVGGNTLRGAFLRPPNRDRDVRGLYFAGGASHPGGGLPLVALSGKIAASLMLEDF